MRPIVVATVLSSLLGIGAASAASAPPGVANFVKQLTQRCEMAGGKPTMGAKLTQKVNLNNDKLDDWVLDESAMTCPGGPPPPPAGMVQVMAFAGDKSGDAQPVFQQGAFGLRVESGKVWLAVRGPACGPKGDSNQFCDRPLVWNEKAARLEFAPMAQVRSPSRIRE